MCPVKKNKKLVFAKIGALVLLTCFALKGFSFYNEQTGETVFAYKSALVWRTDGTGDYLLPPFASNGVYQLVQAGGYAGVSGNDNRELEV